MGYFSDQLLRRLKLAAGAEPPPTDDAASRVPPKPAGVHRVGSDSAVNRAARLRAQSRYAEALALLNEALAKAPQDAELELARGSTLVSWGRFRESLPAYRRARALGGPVARSSVGIGIAHWALGEIDEAIESMQAAIAADPTDIRWRHYMGALLEAAGRSTEAITKFESVLASDPGNIDARVEICRSLISVGKPAQCIVEARRLLERAPRNAEATALAGIAELLQNRPGEALEWLARAASLAGPHSDLEIFDQVAVGLTSLGRTRECVDMLEGILPERPNLNGHLGYAAALLSEGRFLDGWRQFEFRWFIGPLAKQRPNYGRPVWGGQDLQGKTVLVRAEQGFGDVFQMLRYLPLLKARGARVLLQPILQLASMYRQLGGVDLVLEPNQPLPPFDFWVHMMSLPRIFGTTIATVPAEVPYVRADPKLLARWSPRLAGGGLRVGIVWAGNPKHHNDANRSIPLATIAPLLRTPQVTFYGLQKEPLPAGSNQLVADANFVNLGPELRDFGDTTAIVDQLDLLIAADTAPVHVAGALGRPVWLLVPEPSEYRWLKDREDSPWYPTVRIFRQRQANGWDEVVDRVAGELRQMAEMKAGGATPQALAEFARAKSEPLAAAADAARTPPTIAVAAETRAGLLQYVPARGDEGRSIDWYGDWLHSVLETLLPLLQQGQTVLEAGSGYGAHAIMMGRVLGTDGHLLAYESDPVTRRMLAQNLAANGVRNVTVMQRRLGAGKLGGGSDAVGAEAASGDGDWIDGLQLDRLDWLKINPGVDALAVLGGARDSLWRLRPRMLVAAAHEAESRTIAELCREYGYLAWRLDTPLFRAANFNGRANDIFDGRKAIVVLALPEEAEVGPEVDSLVAL